MKALTESWKTLKLMRSLKEYKQNSKESESEARKHLLESFADKNGVQFKIAQYFDLGNSIDGLALRDYAMIPMDEVVGILTKEWGSEVLAEFDINWEFVKSASMGQVHLARLNKQDKDVIIKVLYPEIRETIVNQIRGLELASFIPSALMSRKYKLQMDDYLEKLKQILEKECDLRNEVKAKELLQESMKDCPWVNIPEVLEEYCSSNILVQEFDSGLEFEAFLEQASSDEQKAMGESFIKIFLHQIFKTGFLQGDTNKGNFLFRSSPSGPEITLIDYGNYFQLSMEFRKNLFSLMQSLIDGREIDPFAYFSGMGFEEEKLRHFHKSLPLLVQKLFAPFVSQIPFDLKRWKLSRDVDLILGEHKWWFRSSGGVEFFQLMKSIKGLFGMLQRLDVNFNWRHIFLSYTQALKSELFLEHAPLSANYTFTSLAKSIIIQVKEKGSDKVNLSLPAAALMNLKDLMDPELIGDLQKRGVDVDSVIRNAISEGGYPGVLFTLEDGEKNIEISLR